MIPIINLPVQVRYLSAEQGGVSHFRVFWDNLCLSFMHARLCTTGASRWCMSKLGIGS